MMQRKLNVPVRHACADEGNNMTLAALVKSHIESRDFTEAFGKYQDIVLSFSENKTVLEIGAGRRPLITPGEIDEFNINYFGSDILESELQRVEWLKNCAVFDICGEIPPELEGKFDFVFSKMVLEHVPDGEAYYANILRLLKPGGSSLTFHPTLYSPVFVINRLLPEPMSAWLLKLFFPYRNEEGTPKFPARYHFCYSTKACISKIEEIGFSAVESIPFYSHNYYEGIPGLRFVSKVISEFIAKQGSRRLCSFAYTIAKS